MTISRFARLACGLVALAACVGAQTITLDPADTPEHWKVIASDGVDARLSLAEDRGAKVLRLDFDFRKGAGFCVLHLDTKQTLAENYRFGCRVRGEGLTNQLEFKLLDSSGDSVWWVRNGEFEFPKDWTPQRFKKRHFQFAWGPSNGAPLTAISGVELAIAANSGGAGHLLIGPLTYEALPAPTTVSRDMQFLSLAAAPGERPRPRPLLVDGVLDWHSSAGVEQPAFRIDLGQVREIGGLALDWDERDFPAAYRLAALDNACKPLAEWTRECDRGGREYVRVEGTEARFLEVSVTKCAGQGVGLKRARVLPVEFAESLNKAYEIIAQDAPRGWYPRYFLNQQCYWTVVGVPSDDYETLLDQDGSLEIAKRGPRLEPFLYVDGRLLTWAEAQTTQTLADGALPIPQVVRKHGDLALAIQPVALGPAGDARTYVAYKVKNGGAARRSGKLFIAARPFQVLPPWQQLNLTGGAIALHDVLINDQLALLGKWPVGPWQRASGLGLASFGDGDVVEFLARGQLPPRTGIQDESTTAGCAWSFDFDLAPGAEQMFVFNVPMPKMSQEDPCGAALEDVEPKFAAVLKQAEDRWRTELSRVTLKLPPVGQPLVDTFRANQAYVLINADRNATQPGSRTYERSWIRDGAVTATSWCYTGRSERAVAFADWYSKYLFENGKVPCVVDRRGPDPVPENDSNGEYLYLLWRCYQFAHDRAFLERHLEHAASAVDYIDTLRRSRMTDAYRTGTPEQRACFGLMPESISHEGYSAKPMHSYWDDLWTLRGLKDAVRLAEAAQRPDLLAKWTPIRDEFRAALAASLRLAMQNKSIDYIPGCVELGDFDATSTAVALFPCSDEAVPARELANTFERYWKFVDDRRTGRLDWKDYTPYELRTLRALLMLGHADRAQQALDFFMHDQRPTGWRHWAEVVWRDPNAPRFIGDMPHTWVGAEFLTSIRSFFVYEDEDANKLVLAAGVRSEWLDDGGTEIRDWPTVWGPVSYTLKRSGHEIVMDLDFKPEGVKPAVELAVPGNEAIQLVTVSGKTVAADGRKVEIPAVTGKVVVTLQAK